MEKVDIVNLVLDTSPDDIKDVVNATLSNLRYKWVSAQFVRERPPPVIGMDGRSRHALR